MSVAKHDKFNFTHEHSNKIISSFKQHTFHIFMLFIQEIVHTMQIQTFAFLKILNNAQ